MVEIIYGNMSRKALEWNLKYERFIKKNAMTQKTNLRNYEKRYGLGFRFKVGSKPFKQH